MLCGCESNHRFGVAVAICHRLIVYPLRRLMAFGSELSTLHMFLEEYGTFSLLLFYCVVCRALLDHVL